MYKLGVIGGMGPLATVKFYDKIVLNTEAHNDNEHIDLIVLNHSTMPDRTKCIIENKDTEFLNEIKKDLEILERIGIDVVAIPCNTSHYFYDEFKNFTNLKIINMIEETILEIKRRGIKKVAVFGTLGTLNSKVYNKYAKENGIEVKELSLEDKKTVMDIIYKIKETNNLESKDFVEILNRYCNDKTIGIIACTELSLLDIPENLNTIDALDVLVNKSIEYSGAKIKNKYKN
ncbi:MULTISPECIES: aspartate/glutamate racemase family protein [Parvimonas]|uniref:Amino acid racemase n=1 Tax=Parvimonas micra TaxID=33033 RepID=A0AAX3K5T1_9FIRM|nr:MULTISPECIES: amino acid racemase [Parvimonas]AXU10056.1 aspartate/glutamate racemase family protein [Parvimonas micra]MCK6130372.1 amino acid racemase [Parvimonas micra]MCK6136019.1 amino acid racemase [Parvimonas micra]MCK6137490.1 amino acid racemase [Parvimonas micra]MCK6154018.1 amino acid racemase [Parvimonas micra]